MIIKNKKQFFISFILLLLCFAAMFYPVMNGIVLKVDTAISSCINTTLAEKNLWTIFWGLLNKTSERYVSISVMIVIALIFIFKSKDKRLAISLVLSMIFYLELAVFLKLIILRLFDINRLSPSNIIENYNRLSVLLNDRTIKDGSGSSFPGDHAMVLFFIVFYSQYFYTKGLKSVSWFFAIFFTTPRVISGSHWLSDIIGSIIIIYFYTNLIVLTPLHDKTVGFIKKILTKCSRSSVG